MNILTADKQAAVLRALVEGNSLRATARMTGVARQTVANLLRDVGSHCKNHHDRMVMNVKAERIQADEIWSFCAKKEKNASAEEKERGEGDCWTWVAIDPDSKLVVSYKVGSRSGGVAHAFMYDLADRLANRVKRTTDALNQYLGAVEDAFGWNGVDYGRLLKIFGASTVALGKYSPAKLVRTEKERIMGEPEFDLISTSHVERQNLTMRMQMRRFTRLTNGFSKKVEFHLYAVALHYTHYNYVRPHITLSKEAGKPTTPAMAAGLSEKPWSFADILNLLQSNKAATQPIARLNLTLNSITLLSSPKSQLRSQMKPEIHPVYAVAKVSCACGNTFQTRSTQAEIHLDICAACHPFFTGKQKLIDTAGRVERFRQKYNKPQPATV